MIDIQYVVDEAGKQVAVQIPIDQWEIIKAKLELYEADEETAEILADPELLKAIQGGREQARQRLGRPIEEIDL